MNNTMNATTNNQSTALSVPRIFENTDFGTLAVMMIDGKPYFPAKDCAKILGYVDASQAIRMHCKGGVKITTPSNGGLQEKNFIPEGDLYRLIVRSKLPAAVEFEKWVFDKVLPTIRQTGAFMNNDQIADYLCSSKGAIQLLEAIVDRDTKIGELESRIEQSQPLVTMAESIMSTDGLITIGDLAKILRQNDICIGRDRLFMYLRDNGYLMKSGLSYNIPTQKAMEKGLFRISEKKFYNKYQSKYDISRSTQVTPKGQLYFINLFLNDETWTGKAV